MANIDITSFTYSTQPHSAPTEIYRSSSTEGINETALKLMSDPRVIRGSTLSPEIAQSKDITSKNQLSQPSYGFKSNLFCNKEINVMQYLISQHDVRIGKLPLDTQTNDSIPCQDTSDFKFKLHGAALLIQNWFKRNRYIRKLFWKRKYSKYIKRLRSMKLLLKAIRKSKCYNFNTNDISNKEKLKNASSIVIERFCRGYIARKKMKYSINSIHLKKTKYSIKIQSIMRKCLIRLKYPFIGQRYRMFQTKQVRWKKFQDLIIPQNVHSVYNKDIVLDNTSDYLGQKDVLITPVTIDNIPFLFLLRRKSFLFLSLKLGDIRYLLYLNEPTLQIQCCWRQYKAKKTYKSKIVQKNYGFLIKIYIWLYRIIIRKRIIKSLRIIQPIWKLKSNRMLKRKYASIKIQAYWRCYAKYKWFKSFFKLRDYCIKMIVKWIQKKLRIFKVRNKLKQLRQLIEIKTSGEIIYKATELRWYVYHTWKGAKKKSYSAQHETQKLFLANSINGGIDLGKLIKLFRECKNLLNEEFTPNVVELQYTRVKNNTDKRIDYETFLNLCMNLAIIKFMKIDPAKTKENMIEQKSSSSNEIELPSINIFIFAGLKGRNALITKFIITFLSTTSEYQKASDYLKIKYSSNKVLSQTHIINGIKVIQLFLKNRKFVKRITKELVIHKESKINLRRNNAANIINSCVRGFLGRRFIIRLAQMLYCKYIDGQSEREYWSNPRTGSSLWIKPKLLGEFDCGIATRMPRREELFVVKCNECKSNNATCFCDDCNEPYCTMCYALNHKATRRKDHIHILIENCIQCEFQIGTFYCESCQDTFCDSCFRYMHKKGRLRFHVYQRVGDVCEQCDYRSAQWKEVFLNPTEENKFKLSFLWCNDCYFANKRIMPKDVPVTHPPTITRILFYGKSVKQFREKLALEKKQNAVAKAFELRKHELKILKEDKALRLIQRVYRGYKKRKNIEAFIRKRKEFLRLRDEDLAFRNSWIYYITSTIGIAKSLKSDTPLEKVLKPYPKYMHHILEICIDKQWSLACKLQMEHENHMENIAPKSWMIQRVIARFNLKSLEEKYTNIVKKEKTLKVQYKKSAEKYQMAKASGAISAKKLQILKDARSMYNGSLKTTTAKKIEIQTRLKEANEKVILYEGPQGLHKLVHEKRTNGICMPFTVTIHRYSRLALVTWNNSLDTNNPDESNESIRSLLEYEPGKWKNMLSVNDFIIINGSTFRVTLPSIVKRKHSGRRKSRPTSASSDVSSNNSDTEEKSYHKKRPNSAKSDSSIDSKNHLDDSKRPESANSDTSETSKLVTKTVNVFPEMEKELIEETTEDHITLDRPWMSDDIEDLKVYKVLPRIFYYKPLFFLQRKTIETYPIQKIIAISAITQHKYGKFLEKMVLNIDQDNPKYEELNMKIEKVKKRKNKILNSSRTIVQMSYDFSLRRRTYFILRSITLGLISSFRLLRGIIKTYTSAEKESALEFWMRSMSKVDIVCVLDNGNNNDIELGEFKMDLNAPCDIMREYIRRSFREELNKTIGESFLFSKVYPITFDEEILPRDSEFKTYSRTYCIEKTNSKTMLTSMTILIIPDKERGRVIIPEVLDKKNSNADENDEEMQKLLDK